MEYLKKKKLFEIYYFRKKLKNTHIFVDIGCREFKLNQIKNNACNFF